MLDTLDIAVIAALSLAVLYYFGKDFIFSKNDINSADFGPGGDDDRNLVAKLRKHKKNCVVFYGSQTGTAEDYSHKLAKELRSKFGLQVLTADLADYDYDNFQDLDPKCLLFFLVATYGEGEPTDNAVEFFNWLDSDADQMTINFTVFGLGNSTYEFYNAMGNKVNDKLELLGGERFAPYGQGDDGVGTMDEDFITWKEECFDSLRNNMNIEEHELKYEPSFELVEESLLNSSDAGVSNGEPTLAYVKSNESITKGPFDHLHPYLAQISATRELFSDPNRSCVHAEFDLSPSNLKYSTGDHLAIWPSNSNEAVVRFLDCFDLTTRANDVFSLKSLDNTASIPFPSPITYGAVVRHHLEITGPISRQSLNSIAPFAPSAEAKAECSRLGADKAAFALEIHEKKLNLADALLVISGGQKWSEVPFVFLIELIATLQPRYYSISSSSLNEKSTIHITAVVEAEKVDDRMVTGVATNLLKDIESSQNKRDKHSISFDLNGPKDKFKGFKLPVHVRRSTFKLPSNPSTPIILIGPGTGIAPMRGFIREKVAMSRLENGSKLGKILLFYGCRNEDEDFLYKDEWPQYAQALGDSFEMEVAFSRKDPTKKVYVQHKLKARAREIDELLKQGAFVYVCGDASRMARDVQNSLIDILSEARSLLTEKAAEVVRSLKVQNRYQEDVW